MKFPRIEVAYNIVFNNTGLDWTDIQDEDNRSVKDDSDDDDLDWSDNE